MRFLISTDLRSASDLADVIEEIIGVGKCEVTARNPSAVSVGDADYPVAAAIVNVVVGRRLHDVGEAPVVHIAAMHSAYLTSCHVRIDTLASPDRCVTAAGWSHENPVTCPRCRAAYLGETDEPTDG
jgi:hypothetical protein